MDLEAVLDLVFHGSVDSIRQRLKPLNEDARATAFAGCSKMLATLRRCCRRYDEGVEDVSLARLEATARGGGIGDLAKMRVDDGHLLVRVLALWIGLAGRRQVTAGLKRHDDVDWNVPMVEPAAAVLLDRPEPWAEDVLFEWFEHLHRWTAGTRGAVTLLRDLIEQHPDWRPRLEPYVSRWTAIEGFAPGVIGTLPPFMLIAGLLDDDRAVLTDWQINPRVTALVKAGEWPRRLLLETTLDKLRTPMRQGLERAWVDLLATIAPTEAERDEQAERYEELLTAPGSAPARLGLDEAARRLDALAVDPEHAGRLVGLLAVALEHRVQLVAKQAFRLLATLVELQPAVVDSATPNLIQALGSPHAALRKAVLAWLKRSDPSKFGADDLALLAELADDLDLDQRSMIGHLLPAEALAEPEREVHRPPLDVGELLARASRHEADLRPVDRRRVAWLEAYQQHGKLPAEACGMAEAPAPMTPFESVEAMVDVLSTSSDHGFTAVERERLLDGVTRFALDESDRTRVRRLFDPVLQRVAGNPWIDARDHFIVLILHAWTGAALPDAFATSDEVDDQQVLALAAHTDSQPARPTLSAMTDETGWLDPVTFAERWLAEPRRSDHDLERALYRLSRDGERRLQAWSLLEGRCPDPVVIALGPDTAARSALARSTAALPQAAPAQLQAEDATLDLVTDILIDDPAEREGDSTGRDALIASAKERDASSRELAKQAMRFRLLIAALRCRFGLEDARRLCSAEDLERMGQQIEIEMSYRDDHKEAVREFLFERLLFPSRPDPSEFPEDLQSVRIFHDWPAMAPYRMASTYRSVSSVRVERHASLFPPIAQRLFEAGMVRLDQAMEYKSSLGSRGREALQLLEAARIGHVEVGAELQDFLLLFSCKFPANRESAIDLALGWLHDGRVLPREMAQALAGSIAAASKGAKYVDEALESISVTGDGGARVVQMALEIVVVDSLQELPPRTRTLVLDRLLAVVEALQDGVRDPAARARLEELATAKKASAVRERSRSLVGRATDSATAAPDLPLAVESLAALLDESLTGVE